MDGARPTWLLIDVDMLAADLQQLRIHLRWLQEDLRDHPVALDGAGGGPAVMAQVDAGLDGLAALDGLLATLRRALSPPTPRQAA